MKRAAAAVIAAALAACTASPGIVAAPMLPPGYVEAAPDAGAPGRSLDGDYTGTGVQSDGPEWPMVVHFLPAAGGGGARATVQYPSLGCASEWKLERAGDGEWTGQERVTTGSRCIAFGLIHVKRVDESSLEWDWHDTTEKLRARATLTRVKK